MEHKFILASQIGIDYMLEDCIKHKDLRDSSHTLVYADDTKSAVKRVKFFNDLLEDKESIILNGKELLTSGHY